MAIVLVVEDGTGKSDANTYTSVIYADTFSEQRGRSAWLSLEDDEKAAALIKATEFICLHSSIFIFKTFSSTY